MSFLNKKERVVDFQLSSYGKLQLAKGKFNPKYYTFCDSGIIYDYQTCGVTEQQNSSSVRIKDTYSLEVQSSHAGVETQIYKANKLIRNSNDRNNIDNINSIQATNDKHYSIFSTLGNSQLGNQYIPSWNVNFVKGEITGSIEYLTGSHQTIRIPQLNCEPDYEIKIKYTDQGTNRIQNEGVLDELVPIPEDIGLDKIYDDGSYIDITEENLLIDILENNVDYDIDNFDIEVFRVETDKNGNISGSVEDLIPLNFIYKENNRGIIVNNTNNFNTDFLKTDSSFVEYFFDISVDNEIPEEDLCNYEYDNADNIFINKESNCKTKNKKDINIYKDSNVFFDEDCD